MSISSSGCYAHQRRCDDRVRLDPRQQGARRPHDPRHRRRRVRRGRDLGGRSTASTPASPRTSRAPARRRSSCPASRSRSRRATAPTRRCTWLPQPAAHARRSGGARALLESMRTAGARLDTQRSIEYKDRSLARRATSAASPATGSRSTAAATSIPGATSPRTRRRPATRVVVINDELAEQAVRRVRPARQGRSTLGGEPFKVIGVYHYEASFLSGGNRPRAIVPIESARKHLKAHVRTTSASR